MCISMIRRMKMLLGAHWQAHLTGLWSGELGLLPSSLKNVIIEMFFENRFTEAHSRQ